MDEGMLLFWTDFFLILAGILIVIILSILFLMVIAYKTENSIVQSTVYLSTKVFIPAQKRIVLFQEISASLSQLVSYPDYWFIIIDIKGEKVRISVDKWLYDSLSEGDPLIAQYTLGFFGKINIKRIFPANFKSF